MVLGLTAFRHDDRALHPARVVLTLVVIDARGRQLHLEGVTIGEVGRPVGIRQAGALRRARKVQVVSRRRILVGPSDARLYCGITMRRENGSRFHSAFIRKIIS
jgi:hypothetical protein